MKKIILIATIIATVHAYSQEHFSGITTSKRVGIVNGSINPSEFANLSSKYEIHLLAASINVSNNKVGFNDLAKSDNVESLIFNGKGPVNFDISAAILGPSFAMRYKKWGFGINSRANVKASIIDLDADLGNALINDNLNSVEGITSILSAENQRVSATTYGEIGLSLARTLYQKDSHQLNGGVTLKLLFPSSFANIGLNNFTGDIVNNGNNLALTNTNTSLNLAYSGNFASSFNETSDYMQSIFGSLNGFATDLGVDYQWLKEDKTYKLKIGASVRNIGSMTFSGNDNVTQNYALNIPSGQSLNLDVFENVEGAQDIEEVLDNSGFFTQSSSDEEFKVKLPTIFNFYADYAIFKKVSITAFLQQKMGDQNNDNQIRTTNILSVTPRVTFGPFEAFVPVGYNEISGQTLGCGFRLGGFFLGSNSIISAVASNSQQADIYFGFRFGFRKN